MKDFLEAGVAVGTHGIHGDMKVKLLCDDYKTFAALKSVFIDGNERRIVKRSPYKNIALVRLDGIDTPEDAARLSGKVLFARREDIPLPEDRVFIADIIGLPVKDAQSGQSYGVLTDVIEGGASQLYEIECGGKKAYMPAIKEFIDRIDINDAIYVKVPEGMFT